MTGDLPRAIEASQKSKEILEQLVRSVPNNATLQEYLGEAYAMMADIFVKQGELELSIDYYTQAREVFVGLASTEPTNSLARDNAALMELSVGDVLLRKGKIGPSIPGIRDAIAAFEKVERRNRYEIAGQATAYASLGRAFFSLAGRSAPGSRPRLLRESRSWYEKSLNTFRQETGPRVINPLENEITEQSVRQELSKSEEALTKAQEPSTNDPLPYNSQVRGAMPVRGVSALRSGARPCRFRR